MFSFQESRGSIEVAFTDRHGGVSDGPYASLNLAEPSLLDDVGERAAVARNIDIVRHAMARGSAPGEDPFAVPSGVVVPHLVGMRQVHGAEVRTVDRSWLEGQHEDPPRSDGVVTAEPGVVLLVRAADCVPVLLADVEARLVGAAHAGRVGLVAGVVPATVRRLRDLGARRIVGWVGPHICGACYEVPAAMRQEVAEAVPAAFAETSWGTPALDVGRGVTAQLEAGGVEVVDASRCTFEDHDLYSYRREGARSGRFGGLVWVRP